MYMKKEKGFYIAGPIFVLCTLALAPVTLGTFIISTVGLFACSVFSMRGFFYALGSLALFAVWEFAFFMPEHPWWHSGFFISYAIAFYITAATGFEKEQASQSLHSQWEALKTSFGFLEEEVSRVQEENAKEQAYHQEKIESLQKLLEEGASEHSSVLMLNEVLRKTSARHLGEAERAQADLQAMQVRFGLMMDHYEALQAQIQKYQNEPGVVSENQQLQEALHGAQMDKEQTHLINETLARLHAKENLRAQKASEQVVSLESAKQELVLKLDHKEEELARIETQVAQLTLEKSQIEAQVGFLQQERHVLQGALTQMEEAQKHQAMQAPDLSQYVVKSEVVLLEERVKALTQVDLLYKQLKNQFEERNQLLHQARKKLFLSENELETLKIEKERQEQMGYAPFSEIVKEFDILDNECLRLQEENEALQQIVTALNTPQQSVASVVKKATKGAKKNVMVQTSLFTSDAISN